MTTKQTVYAARTQTDVYAITEEMKLASRKRYSEQRSKKNKAEKKAGKVVVQAPAKKKK